MNNTDSKANSRRIISLITYIVITAVLTQLDQITKYVAESNLYMKNDIDIIKNVLTLTYLRNNGSAFGMFSGKISISCTDSYNRGCHNIYRYKNACN